MSWDKRKPVTGKLPTESGNWQGNQVVETLTGYWDDQLSDLKDFLDSPVEWLSVDSIRAEYLDYVGKGLCGFGNAWLDDYTEEVKRRLIKNHAKILISRGSKESIETLIKSLVPNSLLVHFSIPRADISLADMSFVSDFPTNRYMICLPTDIKRGGLEWRWFDRLINIFMPIGEISLQYQVNLPGQTLAGDWSIN